MVAPNGATRSNGHKPAEHVPKRPSVSLTRGMPKKSNALRLVLLAAVAWLCVLSYTHAVFSKHSLHDHMVQKKEMHPAHQFLQQGQNLRQGVAAVRRKFLNQKAAAACERTMHKSEVQHCTEDIIKLYHMDERVAYHYMELLRNSEQVNLRGAYNTEHPCMRISLAKNRASCYQDVLSTNNLIVAQKMAELLKIRSEDDGVTVHDAKIACALAREKDLCLHDVLGTGDLDVADIYDQVEAPQKDELGKYLLQYHHHKFTQQNAIQSCKMVHPEDRKMCQEHVLEMDDEETAEHYIHLLQDQEHHQEDAEVMTQDEAELLCQSVQQNHYQEQCLEDIGSLPNRHMADHFLELYNEPQADSLVPQRDAEKLCHHLRLSHHSHKYEACVQSLTQMKGIQAASHYSKLLRLHKKVEDDEMEDPAEKQLLTGPKAKTVCEKVRPEKQEECQRDVQTMNDWDTAEKYAHLLSPPDVQKKDASGVQADKTEKDTFKEKATAACGKSAHKDEAPYLECVRNLTTLYNQEARLALHFILLLNNSDERNLKGAAAAAAAHPCERINVFSYRATCYQDTLATNDLVVARKMADLLNAQAVDDNITEHDAKIVCALAERKDLCIHDVLAIGDLEVADNYEQLPMPKKDKDGKFQLEDIHHKFTEKDAIQACAKQKPENQKRCQEHVIKMDDKETAEHYIHLLQDQEHHQDDAKPMTAGEAKALCTAVKNTQHQEQCVKYIGKLPNKHTAVHFVHLFDDEHAEAVVPQLDAEKLCHHVKLTHPARKLFESCVQSLMQLKGLQAASHYSKLLELHRKVERLEEDSEDKVLLTKAKATSICAKVQPQQRQEECQQDVQTMNDWDTADKYAQLLSPSDAGKSGGDIKKEAEEACKKSMNPDDVSECVDDLVNLNEMNPPVASHYIGLLKYSKERNLEGAQAEHPCMQLNADTHRATCYQHVLATSSLGVAKKMAQFLKADEDHKPGVTLHDASIACALAKEKGTCIHDVLGTGDLESAEMYDNHEAPQKDQQGKLALHGHHHRMTEQDAEQACRLVHPLDQEKCQKHVLTMDNEETATHYIHLLQDAEHHLTTGAAISDSEATSLCSNVKNTKHHQQCLDDVHMLPNQHVAEHIIQLYDDEHASAKVSLQDAQQLCNHLRLSKKQNDHGSCVKHLTGVKGIEAAAHCSKILQRSNDKPQNTEPKPLLTKAEADSICKELKPSQLAEECRRDVLTLNDLVVAQHFAQHFAGRKQEAEQSDEGKGDEENGTSSDKAPFKTQAMKACKKAIHPDDVAECIRELSKLNAMNPAVAQHFIQLLVTQQEENLEGLAAEHPCLSIDLEMQRAACYQDVLATNDLVVANQIAQLMKEKVENSGNMGPTLHDASIACALAREKALCIHDVMGTMDIEAAEAYEKHAAPPKDQKGQLNLQSHHHQFSEKDAVQACRLVHTDDREKCKQHVLTMDSEQTAEHYIHLLQDIEHHSESQSMLGPEEAKLLCTHVKNTQHHRQCMQDIGILPNQHIASHFLPLYEDKAASDVVSQQEAEKLCNHLRLNEQQSDHDACIKYMTNTKGIEAAAHASKLLQPNQSSKPKSDTKKLKKLLSEAQADAICGKVKAGKTRDDCKKGVATLNDLDVAQRFAELLDPEAAKKRQAAMTDPGKEGDKGMTSRRLEVKKQAETACRKTIHKDDFPDCVDEVLNLEVMNPEVSRHYIHLLMASSESNLEGAEAQHPCMKIKSQTHRAACYQDISATNELAMAKKVAQVIKDSEELEPVQVTLHDATIACALARQKGTCIHDVLGTGDIEAAEMYEKIAAPKENKEGKLELGSHHHKMSEKEAEAACKILHLEDREKCKAHVLTMDDESTAEHYIHLLQDSEHHSTTTATISEGEAKTLCASVKSAQYRQQCLEDIQSLPNKHLAEHLIPLYDEDHATAVVSQQDAEKLCNHFRLKNKDNSHNACLRYLTKTKGIEAAAHSIKLLRMVEERMEFDTTKDNDEKQLLTEKQADSVCGKLEPGKIQQGCKKDVQRLTDLDVAQRYVQLLAIT